MTNSLIEQSKALDFMLAGKSIFTAKSLNTNDHLTYKIQVPKDNKKNCQTSVWWVSVLSGPDNENDYTYIGSIYFMNGKYNFMRSAKSRVSDSCKSVVVIKYLIEKFSQNKIVNNLELWHEGRCCRCGRKLTTPESVQNGIGPECMSMPSLARRVDN